MNLKLLGLLLLFTLSLFSNEKGLESLSIQLKWKHQFQFAGYYMAKEKGFYKDAGLDVSIQEYTNNVGIVQSVLEHKATYGVGYPSVVLDKAQGKDIVLLAAIYQDSPHILITLHSSGIRSIRDFKDRTIMINPSATTSVSFISMLRANSLSFSDMNIIAPSFDIESLLRKEADISSAYISNEPYKLEVMGVKYDVWDPKEYGFDFYDDILFTSMYELKHHPKRVEKFKAATLRGFEYAFSHISESVALIEKKYNTQKKSSAALTYEALALKKLVYRGVSKIGEINRVKIQRIIDIYNLFGLLHEKIDVDSFIYKVSDDFSLNAEEKRYLERKRVIKMCVDPDWMPFEKIEKGKHIGMSADFFALVNQKLGERVELLPTESWDDSLVKVKERACDIISLVMKTPEREGYLRFTTPYLKIPLVMATKLDAPFTTDLSSLEGKKLGIPKGYAFAELLRVEHPELDIVEVKNLRDGLEQVNRGDLYGYIGTLATIGYSIQKEFTGALKIAAKFDGSWDLGIGVRSDDPLLYSILEKIVSGIDEKQKQKILNSWLSISYDKSTDYQLLFEAIGAFVVVLLILLFFYMREKKLSLEISAQKDQLELNHALLETLFNTIPNPVYYKDREGVYQSCNRAFSEGILMLPKEEIIGKTLDDLLPYIPKNLLEIYKKKDEELYKNLGIQNYEGQVKHADGELRNYNFYKACLLSESEEILGIIGVMLDITELKEKERELEILASVDPLSKLYNRRYFTSSAEDILRIAKREKEPLSLIMLDIDNFKNVNDLYGHKVGDDVIVALSRKLLEIGRSSDVVCRFGGEEFIILLPKTALQSALIVANKIRESIEKLSIKTGETKMLSFTVSVGVSEINLKEQNIEAAIKRADDALYMAKNSGKNRVCTLID